MRQMFRPSYLRAATALLAAAAALCPAAAQAGAWLLTCAVSDGSVLITDTDHCPAGARELSRRENPRVPARKPPIGGSSTRFTTPEVPPQQRPECVQLLQDAQANQALSNDPDPTRARNAADKLKRIRSASCRLKCGPC